MHSNISTVVRVFSRCVCKLFRASSSLVQKPWNNSSLFCGNLAVHYCFRENVQACNFFCLFSSGLDVSFVFWRKYILVFLFSFFFFFFFFSRFVIGCSCWCYCLSFSRTITVVVIIPRLLFLLLLSSLLFFASTLLLLPLLSQSRVFTTSCIVEHATRYG